MVAQLVGPTAELTQHLVRRNAISGRVEDAPGYGPMFVEARWVDNLGDCYVVEDLVEDEIEEDCIIMDEDVIVVD